MKSIKNNRKLLFATGLFLALSSIPASANLLIYEPFNYTPGSAIIGQVNNYSPLSPTWVQAGTNNPNPTLVHQAASPGLTAPGGLPASFGNAGDTKTADYNEYARISLGHTYTNNSTVYYSLLLNVPTTDGLTVANTNPNCNNDGIIAINNTVGSQPNHPTSWGAELVIRLGSAANKFNLGIRASTTAAGTTYFTGDLTPGQTYFIVASYSIGASQGSGGVNSIWLNPDSSTYGAAVAPTADGTTVGNINGTPSNDHMDSIIIGAGIATNATPNDTYIDEIRVGTTWADVTSNTVGLTIVQQPQDVRLVVGLDATFQAAGFLATSSQWYYSNTVTHAITAISGATNTTLTVTNAQLTNAGAYALVASYGGNSVTSNPAFLYVYPDTYPHLAPIWEIAPFQRPYIDTYSTQLPMERYFAFNSLSNQVLIVSRTNVNTLDATARVYALDGKSGADLYQMNANPIVINAAGASGITLNTIDVADDGAVYAANISPGSAPDLWSVYRWADSGQSTEPVQVYQGDPWGLGNDRFGDSLVVRGSGTGTQILGVDQKGIYGTILTPTDSSMATFTANGNVFTNVVGGTTGGRTVVWGQTNTFWEHHRNGGLQLVSYDLPNITSTLITNYNNFPSSMGVCGFNFGLNLICGINFKGGTNTPDTLDLYDITDPTGPIYVASYNFPTNSQPNANVVGRVMWVAGDRVYAMDGNNGFIAMTVVPKLNISHAGGSTVLSWNTNYTDYVLQAGTNVLNSTWTNVAPATIVGQNYQVTQPVTGSRLFYRLKFE